MDDFSIFGFDFDECLYHLSPLLKRCQEKNLVLNWEERHFMVKKEIILVHAVSFKGIEVDKEKLI